MHVLCKHIMYLYVLCLIKDNDLNSDGDQPNSVQQSKEEPTLLEKKKDDPEKVPCLYLNELS